MLGNANRLRAACDGRRHGNGMVAHPMQDQGIKRCSRCGETKPCTDFNRSSRSPDGLRWECRVCHLADAARYRQADPSRVREWEERNPERVAAHKAAALQARKDARLAARTATPRFCAECGGSISATKKATAAHCSQACSERAKNRRWEAANPDKVRAKQSRQQRENPERFRLKNARRRSMLLKAFVEDVHALVVLERADGVCGICGHDVDPFAYEVDHIVPLSRDGEHSYANTQPAHPICNRRKRNRLAEEMAS